jgi:TRAP-type C4-dicarboxylate transport system permease small subunit
MGLDKMARLLEKAGYRTSAFLNVIGAITLALLMLLTAADVAMRDVLNRPISGAYEISMFMMAIVVACGIGYCASRDEHVKVELLVGALPARAQAAIASLTWFLSAVFLGLMTWQCALYSIAVFHDGTTTPDLLIPTYPFIAIVAVGSAVLCVVFSAQFLDALSRALKGVR